MRNPKISRFELELLEQLWKLGPASVREIQESLPELKRPAYTTVQTMISRLEEKKAVRRVKKVGNAHIFEALVTRKAVYRRLIDDLLDLFGGSPAPVIGVGLCACGTVARGHGQVVATSSSSALLGGRRPSDRPAK